MLTPEQKKYLKERLQVATYDRRKKAEKATSIPDTPQIKAARIMVEKFDAARYRKQRQAILVVDKESAKIREILFFADAKDALKAVKAFESK